METLYRILRAVVIYGGLFVLGMVGVLAVSATFRFGWVGWLCITVAVAFTVFAASVFCTLFAGADADRMREMIEDE